MTTPLRRGTAATTAAIAAAAAVVLSASPAAATTKGCTIPVGGVGCSTSSIAANPSTHQIMITAIPGAGSVTCRAHDSANGNEVGRVTANFPFSKDKVIGGLYGSYFLSCLGVSYGGGSITNG